MASSYSSWCWRIFLVPSNKYSMHHTAVAFLQTSFLPFYSVFFFFFFFTWSQAVSAGSVTEVDWKISHETKVTGMMVFWSLWASAESEVQHQVSSWTVPKTARSHWVADLRSPFLWAKQLGGSGTARPAAAGWSTWGSWLEAECQGSSENSAHQQPCQGLGLPSLHVANVQWNQDHKQGKRVFWLGSSWFVRISKILTWFEWTIFLNGYSSVHWDAEWPPWFWPT